MSRSFDFSFGGKARRLGHLYFFVLFCFVIKSLIRHSRDIKGKQAFNLEKRKE